MHWKSAHALLDDVCERMRRAMTVEDGQSSSNESEEASIENSIKSWGGGTAKGQDGEDGKRISISGGSVTDVVNNGLELIDTPWDSGDSLECGNAKEESGEDSGNCPQDTGLPDDVKSSDSGTQTESSTSISDVLPKTDPGTGYLVDDTEDPVKYVADLQAWEFSTGLVVRNASMAAFRPG